MQFRPILIAALQAAGLTAAGFMLPVLGQIAMLFAPVPLIIVAVLHGRLVGFLAALLATAVISGLGAFQTAVILLMLGLVLLALAMAEGILRNLRHESSVILGGIIPLLLALVLLAPVFLKAGKHPHAIVEEYLRRSLGETRELYTTMGLTDLVQTLDSVSDHIIYYASRLFPGIITTTTLLQALFCYSISRSIVIRRRPDLPLAARPPLSLWHLPDQWVWGLIVTLAVFVIAPRDSDAWFIGLNISFFWILAYVAQGAAVVDFLLRKVRIPTLWRSIILAMILTVPPTAVAVVALGVVDIWADFRKVRTPQV